MVEKLSKSWNTREVATTKQGCETFEPIRFVKGLPQGDALCTIGAYTHLHDVLGPRVMRIPVFPTSKRAISVSSWVS